MYETDIFFDRKMVTEAIIGRMQCDLRGENSFYSYNTIFSAKPILRAKPVGLNSCG